MSKKNRKQNQAVPPAAAAGFSETSAGLQTEILSQDAVIQTPDASFKSLIIFCGMILLAAASAWILAIVLPNVSESLIERWIMAALAAALAVFLFIYK